MAKEALTGVVVTLGGTDYSDEISSISIPVSVDELDSTNFASSGWKEMEAGLKGAQLTINFKKDSDLSGLDADVWSSLGSNLAVVVKKSSASVSTTNPSYSFNALVSSWDPISGAVGALHENSVTWTVDGTVTRATS